MRVNKVMGTSLAVAVLALATASGCGKRQQQPGALEPVFDDEHFTVGVATPAKLKRNKEATAQVVVDPIAPYHVNLDFPTKLTVEAPNGVDMTSVSFDKATAQQLDEHKVVFAVPFTPTSKGRKKFQGRIEFAVCTDDECVPAKLPVEFAVVVGKE